MSCLCSLLVVVQTQAGEWRGWGWRAGWGRGNREMSEVLLGTYLLIFYLLHLPKLPLISLLFSFPETSVGILIEGKGPITQRPSAERDQADIL